MPTSSTSLDDAGRLEELRALQLLASPIEPEFDNLTQLASEICDTPVALISFVDQDQIWFKSRVGFDALHGPRENAFCTQAIQGTGPLVVEDATADPRFQKNVYVVAPQGIRFYAGIPLVLSSGHAVGTLCVIDHRARTLSDKQLGSLKKLALQVTALIEAKRIALRLQDEDRNRLVIEQRLDFALNSAEIGEWERDLLTGVTRRSLTHDRLFGYVEAAPGWTYEIFLSHVVEADRSRVNAAYQRAKASGGTVEYEYRVVWPDGSTHWLWNRGRFYSDAEGKHYRAAGVVIDVTERKKIEENLRESEYRWRFAIEGAGDGLWDWDIQNNRVFYSQRWLTMLGLENDTTVHDPQVWSSHLHPQDKDRVLAQVQAHLDAQTSHYANEHRVICKDGSTKWMLGRGLVVQRDADGRPLRMIGTNSDVTARKQAGAALQEQERLLVESQRIAHIGSWSWAFTGPIQWSDETYRLYGVSPETFIPTFEALVNLVHPEDRPLMQEWTRACGAGEKPAEFEFRCVWPDGTVRHLSGRGERMNDAENRPTHIFGTVQDITEQKQAADVLRVSELALQAISQGVMIAGPDQLITSVNASFTSITGYSEAEVLGRNCRFLQGPDTDPETVAAIRAALRRPAEFAGEILNYRKDGSVFWNELTIAPVFDVHGKLAHFIGITRDISTRRAAELQLRLQESQLAQADKLAGLGRWDWNLTDDSASWSDELYRIYGRDPANGVPAFDDWQDTIHPEDKARLAQCIQTALAGASAYHVEFRIFTKDTGQLRYIESRGSSVVDANGKSTNIRGFDLDITARKEAEAALQASNVQLQLLGTCVSRLNDIVLITEAEPFDEPGPRIVFVNDAFVRRTGYSREEVIGQTPRILQGANTQRSELDRIGASLRRWEPVRAELINYTKAGQEFWLELDIVPVANAQGWYTHWIAVERDITERKRAEHALLAALEEKTALLKEVHHRVKNNMQVITSLLRLESSRSTVGDTKAVLGDMQARIRAMALLHESLYRTGTFASVDLGSYLRQLSTESFRAQSTISGAVRLELNLGSVQVSMDQAIPCGLLINELISNCFKHGFPAGVTGHVRIELQPLDTANQWRLKVCDTGVGLPDNFEEKRKNSLGLQLVGDLARQIGGELTIAPNQDKGASFTVNFHALEPAALVMPA